MLIQADHRVAGGETKSEGWLLLDGAGNELRGLLVHFFVVALQDQQHVEAFRNSLTFITWGNLSRKEKFGDASTAHLNRRITRLCRSER